MLTVTSVHCAERIVEISNSKGLSWISSQLASGYASSSPCRIAPTRAGFAPRPSAKPPTDFRAPPAAEVLRVAFAGRAAGFPAPAAFFLPVFFFVLAIRPKNISHGESQATVTLWYEMS